MDEPMSFCGYVAKMSYIDEARYNYRTGIQDNNWEYVYRILNNVMDIQRNAEKNINILNVAKVMEVTLIQIATDRWRDVPYSDAVRMESGIDRWRDVPYSDAVRMESGILTPKYDTQEQIYPAMLAKLKEAADSFADGAATDDISEGDLLFHGDITKWRKYCNSLRLRLAIRISEVSPELAKTTVEEILGNPDRYPVMESNDDNAFFWWQGSDSNYYEPIADQYRTRKSEYCASSSATPTVTPSWSPTMTMPSSGGKAPTPTSTSR